MKEEIIEVLKECRSHFAVNDKSVREHHLYVIVNRILDKLKESDRIELKTVQSIELLSNYETHLKENYQIEIPEDAMVRFLEQ